MEWVEIWSLATSFTDEWNVEELNMLVMHGFSIKWFSIKFHRSNGKIFEDFNSTTLQVEPFHSKTIWVLLAHVKAPRTWLADLIKFQWFKTTRPLRLKIINFRKKSRKITLRWPSGYLRSRAQSKRVVLSWPARASHGCPSYEWRRV